MHREQLVPMGDLAVSVLSHCAKAAHPVCPGLEGEHTESSWFSPGSVMNLSHLNGCFVVYHLSGVLRSTLDLGGHLAED